MEKADRPTLWIILGPPASGKSTVAKELSEAAGARFIRSDAVRKALFDMAPEESGRTSYQSGIYSPEATRLTYGKILREARKTLAAGDSVILDATFSRPRHREEARRLAEEQGADILFVECTATAETLKRRLADREKKGGVSDARAEHFDVLMDRYETPDNLPPSIHMKVDTEAPVVEVVHRILARSR